MPEPLIKTHGLTKIYKLDAVDVPAVVDVDLTIYPGELVGLMGPSGSGKSTLMHLLGCLDTPSSGEYYLEGQRIDRRADLAKIRREKIGFVFQTFNLIPRLSALQNVELPMIYKGVPAGPRRERAQMLLKSVGLGERLRHRPEELSGGQRQRVTIARALANEPRLILADEPTGNLDSQAGGEVVEILKELNAQGVTILIVTHEEYIAQETQRQLRIFDGRLV